jgi:hypothetical protein
MCTICVIDLYATETYMVTVDDTIADGGGTARIPEAR